MRQTLRLRSKLTPSAPPFLRTNMPPLRISFNHVVEAQVAPITVKSTLRILEGESGGATLSCMGGAC